MIIDIVAERVRAACRQADNKLSSAFYQEHILVVVDYCDRLSDGLHADREILLLSALLHDISAIQDLETLPDHAARSSRVAESMLRDLDYSRDRAARIKRAVLRHSTPLDLGAGSIEEVILSNADALSQIANPSYWLYFAFRIKGMSFEDGTRWYSRRIAANWARMILPARDLVADRYEQVRTLMSGSMRSQ